jgi:hypothetical protein
MTNDMPARKSNCPTPPTRVPGVRDLVGLALSGGGIRSASFNLGVLQGLAEQKVLWIFDYLSTVSGGGFVGAWWSAWLSRAERQPGSVFPADEELEPDRRQATARLLGANGAPVPGLPDAARKEADRPEASRIARRNDPIHFLRIFSNYLTPRVGALSSDTWRLIAWYTRSLLFTWLALMPLFCAAVLIAQVFYLSNPRVAKAFLCALSPTEAASRSTAVRGQECFGAGTPETGKFCTAEDTKMCYDESLATRLDHLRKPLALFLAACVTLALLWLGHSSARFGLTITGMGLLVVLGSLVLRHFRTGPSSGFPWSVALVVLGTTLLHLYQSFQKYQREPAKVAAEVRASVTATAGEHRSWLTRQLAIVLKVGTFVLLVLLVAGFAHDVVWFLFSGSDSALMPAVRRAGGWGGLLLVVGCAAYTVMKALPSSTAGKASAPGKLGQVLLAVAPPLVLIALALAFGVLSRALLVKTMFLPANVLILANAAAWIALLEVVFAIFESYNDPTSAPDEGSFSWRRFVPDPILRLIGKERTSHSGEKRPWYLMFSPRGWARVTAAAGFTTVMSLASNGAWNGLKVAVRTAYDFDKINQLAATFVAVAVLASVIGVSWARRTWKIALGSARPVVLLGIASASAVLCLLANGGIANRVHSNPTLAPMLAALLWIALLVGGVIGIGWLADPNLLSMHGFYMSRLTRAYLGASNTARDNEEITDAAPGDDVKLTDLWNHSEGGPYHLVNTTLSLVGGSDLATSQRSAENFVMSKYHCGSARAGYRCTAEYMSGELTLGTAAAISGAAVSPTMGSKTPSAALSLLLSLMNVRLGFWAPTPSGRRWNEPHARLWPFYLLRETLANTGQIGTYCYLTDGGHFDNTGIYALVERGCRYIVFCDCGADPAFGFEDIGTAIRRCRIDFGTEITLDIEGYARRNPDDLKSRRHFVRGTIVYQDAHLRMLDIEPTPDSRQGVIFWIKPVVLPQDPADVRQYGLEFPVFPQQSTADQWYDESQFESYRRLGHDSAREAFFGLGAATAPLSPGEFHRVKELFRPES